MKRSERHKRIRKKMHGTKDRPRLSVHRTLRGMWLQLIDDENQNTMCGAHHKELKKTTTKTDQAKQLGQLLVQKAQKKKISSIVFDRSGYKFHGRVKAVADALREGGLTF